MKSLLQFLERKLARYAVPNLTLALALGEVALLAMLITRPDLDERLVLIPNNVLAGEWYRLFSFVILPPGNDILTLFCIYMFYLMGSSLEASWGTFRYNIYLLIAYLATVGVACLNPAFPTHSTYIGVTVFLAFAWLYPEFEILILMIIPVKVKYLALVTWISLIWSFAFGHWVVKLQAIAAVANFLLFFGYDIFLRMRSGRRRMEVSFAQLRRDRQPIHRCTVCGVTERDDHALEFRFCSKCEGTFEYCEIHLKSHDHRAAEPPAKNP